MLRYAGAPEGLQAGRGIITAMNNAYALPDTIAQPDAISRLNAVPATQWTTYLTTSRWLLEGLRAGVFLTPRTAGSLPTPVQTALLTILFFAFETTLARLDVYGPAVFNVQALLSGWWWWLIFIGAAWWALAGRRHAPHGQRSARLAAFFVLALGASVPSLALYGLFQAGSTQRWWPANLFSGPAAYWALYAVFLLWSFGALAVLLRRFVGWSARLGAFMLLMVACTGVSVWQLDQRTWQEDNSEQARIEAAKPRLRLTQQAFEAQQLLLQSQFDALTPQQGDVADVFGLVFAPYATEDVFKRETELVSSVLAERFDARGRVLSLLNHGSTAQTHAWATPLNIERAIQALANRMDLANDVLVVYLTSHGGNDFKLAASHWPLEVEPLTPQQLRAALDKAGIRNRVIAVSACYSGGWVEPLANANTLVMTAADATHTSYGCGRLSELTFFGRAMFDEQLRKTHSFEKAFAAAVPLIKQREIDAGKADGFSNPQISVGTGIQPLLNALEQRLSRLPAATGAASSPIPPAN